jgi:hypothetical protein
MTEALDRDRPELELAADAQPRRVLGRVVVSVPTFTDGEPGDEGTFRAYPLAGRRMALASP